MLKLTKQFTLFSKWEIADYIALTMRQAVRSQEGVIRDLGETDDYNAGWLATLDAARVEAEGNRAQLVSVLDRLPIYTAQEMTERLNLFVDIQRVRAQVVRRRDLSIEAEAALDAWNTWQIMDNARELALR